MAAFPKRAIALAAAAILVAGCSSGAVPSATPSQPTSLAPGATPTPAPTPAPNDLAPLRAQMKTLFGDIRGKKVSVLGAFVDPDDRNFRASVDIFEQVTGASVSYLGTKEFERELPTRVQAGDAPDVALVPQAGVVARYARQGKIKPLPQSISDSIMTNYPNGWVQLGMQPDGKLYGVFHRVNVKGFVFYPKKAFKAKGYAEPKTWTEFIALLDKIVADGSKPLCVGIESGAATGWYITDWLEQIVLRTSGPKIYANWISHDVAFSSPAITRAGEILSTVWNDTYVYGGLKYAASTNYGTAPNGMFPTSGDPKCWLTNQGTVISSFFPKDIQAKLNDEVGAFSLPPIDGSVGAPLEVSGDQAVAFKDRPEIQAFLWYLTQPIAGVAWAKAGGAVFPYKFQDTSLYPSKIDAAAAQSIMFASTANFDASDAMPPTVGAGTVWKELTNWVSGRQSLGEAFSKIDASWPMK